MSLRELYQEIIVDHGRNPRNFGPLPQANFQQLGHNPLCGDKLMLHVLLENNIIKALRFEGCGCAISVASASLMTETVKDKSVADAANLIAAFHALLTQEQNTEYELGKLAVFAGVAEFPARVKCATLAWHTLKAIITHDTRPVSTE